MRINRAIMVFFFLGTLSCSQARADTLGAQNSLSGKSKVTIDSFERKNNVLTLKGTFECASSTNSCNLQLFQTHLLDEEHGIKYFLLKAGYNDLVSKPVIDISNEPMRFWAKFTAPPIEVKQINIVFEGFEPIENVQISDKAL